MGREPGAQPLPEQRIADHRECVAALHCAGAVLAGRRTDLASEASMASVEIVGVRKSYGTLRVLHGIDISIADGEFIVLVGPSGCGKSTLLRMIAGLEEITEGDVLIDQQVVNEALPKDRDIAMVFQSYALYPHMKVRENMGFGLRMRGDPRERIAKDVG